LNYLYKDKV